MNDKQSLVFVPGVVFMCVFVITVVELNFQNAITNHLPGISLLNWLSGAGILFFTGLLLYAMRNLRANQ